MLSRISSAAVACAVIGTTALAMTTLAGPALAYDHPGKTKLVELSTDPYSGDGAQHATEAEPDTLAFKNMIVSAFQVGRFASGGATNTGWATSTDRGRTWKHGYLPGITVVVGGDWARVSDPAVAYDAKFGTWLISGLAIGGSFAGSGLVVNASKDGIHWKDPVIVADDPQVSYDKEWVVCDNGTKSPFYGNCYMEADHSGADQVVMVTSTDGGKTWGPEQPVSGVFGLGGQPLVQPSGTVVVPYSGDFFSQRAFRSTDGGKRWGGDVLISDVSDHEVPGMREEPIPSATIDAKGKIYLVWDDCRFRHECSSNDIVMSTSTDGKKWSDVVRIPIDGVKSGRDHFDPGIGASPTLSGGKVKLGLYYYYYPKADCAIDDCRLEVGYVSSGNAGKTWSKPTQLAGPMKLSWLAQAGGAMVGDYISCDVIGDSALSVFAVGVKPEGGTLNQAMYSAGPLPITGGLGVARSTGVRFDGPAGWTYHLPLG